MRLLVNFPRFLVKELKRAVCVHDDRMLFDRQPDPYDHDDSFSPSRLRPQSPEASIEGSERDPDFEQDQGSMSDGSVRRYREYIAHDTLEGFGGVFRDRNGDVDASIGDPPLRPALSG